jgi:MFS family permease
MAMIQAHRKPYERAGRAIIVATIGFGLATIVFGLSQNFYLSLAMLFLTGVFDNVSVVIRHSLVQLLTPDDMRGRVNAANQVFIGTSNEVGKIESGVTAWLVGPVISVVAGGAGVIAVVAFIASRFREVRSLGKLTDVDPGVPDDPRRGFPVSPT